MEAIMSIEERLERLERNNHRILVGLLAAILLVIGVAAAPKAGGNVFAEVRAHTFKLVDSKGRTRGLMFTSEENGKASLGLSDENGNSSIFIAVDKDGTSLGLQDKNDRLRAALYVDKVGPMLNLFDESGVIRAGLFETSLTLSDEKGNRRARLGLNQNGGVLSTFDKYEKVIWEAP